MGSARVSVKVCSQFLASVARRIESAVEIIMSNELSIVAANDKIYKMTVRPAKTQISLGVRPVWSESSLCAQWVAMAYMPYLTLWDKISQNLAHLEANSGKIFKSHRIFRPSYNTFYEEINIHHTLLCLSLTSYIILKAFDYFGGASKWFL